MRDDLSPWSLAGMMDRLGMIFTGFGLTIINPATFLGFMGAFAGLGVLGPSGEAETWAKGTTLVVGVIAGSTLWWLTLIAGSSGRATQRFKQLHRPSEPGTGGRRRHDRRAGTVPGVLTQSSSSGSFGAVFGGPTPFPASGQGSRIDSRSGCGWYGYSQDF